MKVAKYTVGRKGEELACQYLMNQGHGILKRNWRTGHLEVDIISFDKNGIHFVEVKTRVSPVMADPEESVRKDKQRKIAQAAGRFMRLLEEGKVSDCEDWKLGEMEIHLDVIAVIFEGERQIIRYHEDAYFPIFV